jgi:hypothetical protein
MGVLDIFFQERREDWVRVGNFQRALNTYSSPSAHRSSLRRGFN